MVWVVTWLSVVVLNVDLGLAIGVVFSMMTVIGRTQRYVVPHVAVQLSGYTAKSTLLFVKEGAP
jgi:hypothetical protein